MLVLSDVTGDLALDASRHLLYVEGQLVGFDPVTDNLYFVGEADGRLHIWPVSELLP
jgi:hypothetical protein